MRGIIDLTNKYPKGAIAATDIPINNTTLRPRVSAKAPIDGRHSNIPMAKLPITMPISCLLAPICSIYKGKVGNNEAKPDQKNKPAANNMSRFFRRLASKVSKAFTADAIMQKVLFLYCYVT